MLTAAEFVMGEPVPLHRVQEVILEMCRGRDDICVFGAQAVNVYVAEPRMTQDVDLLTPEPERLAEEVRQRLHDALGIAARVRMIHEGVAYRVYQPRKDGSRHLADVRLVEFPLEDAEDRGGIRFLPVPVLTAMKVLGLSRRRLSPKGATDLADLRRLLLARPDLRTDQTVDAALDRIGADAAAREAWRELLAEPIVLDDDEY